MLKKVTTKDIELIKKYLKIANYKSSNYNIVGMFLWLDDYPLYYLEKDNALFFFRLGILLQEFLWIKNLILFAFFVHRLFII